jgi:hypothetical protein
VGALALALGVGLGAGSAAAGGQSATKQAAPKAQTPCWKTLINDWYDGRIDGTYPIHCYRDALDHLPADVDTYSSARDDIKQALQKRIAEGSNGGTTTTGGGAGGGGAAGGSGGSGGSGSGGSGGSSGSGGSGGSKSANGPVGTLFDATKPQSADSVPVPLIVLGGVAFVLMAAGAAGFLARRTRLRRLQTASAASLPPGSEPNGSKRQ